jgi:hypothetical protein
MVIACCTLAHRDDLGRCAGFMQRRRGGLGEMRALSRLGSRKIDELLRQCGPVGRRDVAKADSRGAGLTVPFTFGRPLEQ